MARVRSTRRLSASGVSATRVRVTRVRTRPLKRGHKCEWYEQGEGASEGESRVDSEGEGERVRPSFVAAILE